MRERLDPATVPAQVAKAASALRAASGRAFLVGGPVRDLLLGRWPTDWDIATDLPPYAVLRVFPHAATVGIEFGRVEVEGIDVVSLRREASYKDGRHPSTVEFGASIEEDLSRRDFTMNAMAAEFDELTVIDPFGGRRDLARRVIRTVGDPGRRLAEDALRSLRALRFRTVLDMELDPSLSGALPGTAGPLAGISGERVFSELGSILLSPAVRRGVMEINSYGLAEVVLPEVFDAGLENVRIARMVGLALSLSPPDLSARLAVLFCTGRMRMRADREASEPPRACDAVRAAGVALDRFNADSSTKRDVTWLLQNVGEQGIAGRCLAAGEDDPAYLARKLLDQAGTDQVSRLVDVERAAWLAAGNTGMSPVGRMLAEGLGIIACERAGPLTLALTGDDVIEILGETGRAVGEALGYLKETVYRNPALNKREILARILRDRWRKR